MYYYCVRNRIPFAAANLKCAATAVLQHKSLLALAGLMALVQIGWVDCQCIGLAARESPYMHPYDAYVIYHPKLTHRWVMLWQLAALGVVFTKGEQVVVIAGHSYKMAECANDPGTWLADSPFGPPGPSEPPPSTPTFRPVTPHPPTKTNDPQPPPAASAPIWPPG